jgi:thioredoxin reductase (NADPH)
MHDLIIIGGGAAAHAAGAYALEKRLDVLLIAADVHGKAGTQQHLVSQVGEEFLGGAEAVRTFQRQLSARPGTVLQDKVTRVSKEDDVFVVETERSGMHEGRAVIVATGATPRPLDVAGAERLTNYGVGYSAVTHAPLMSSKTVAVVGTTFRALRGAAELARIASHIYVIAPRPNSLVTPLARTLRRYPNVSFFEGATLLQVLGNTSVDEIVLEHGGERIALAVDAVFADLGLLPNSDMVAHLLKTAPGGFIWVDERNATTVPGLFAAGDVTTVFVEQILIAIGEGARAATSAYEYILSTLPAPQNMAVD